MEFQGLSEVGKGALDRLSLTCHVDLQRLGNEPLIFLPHAHRESSLIDLVFSSHVVRRHRDGRLAFPYPSLPDSRHTGSMRCYSNSTVYDP